MITFKVDNLKNMNTQLRAFADFLRGQNIADEDIFLSRLASCELITNVIRHSGEAAEFKGELLVDRIAITVTADCQRGLDLKAEAPDVFAEGGRGLYIVNCISINGIERGDCGELRVYIKRT